MGSTSTPRIRTLRVYAESDGGRRVLVDRLWPRGVTKARLQLDEWAKEVAPSDDLRRAFHHGDLGFDAFREEYLRELRAEGEDDAGRPAVHALLRRWREADDGDLVLLYAAKDAEHNHAAVLAEHLRRVAAQLG